MNLSHEERMILLDGLDLSIEVKEYEIQNIKEKTEDDYKTAFMLQQFRSVPITLESLKEEEIRKVRGKINKIQKMRDKINSGQNHILIIPKEIKLALTIANETN